MDDAEMSRILFEEWLNAEVDNEATRREQEVLHAAHLDTATEQWAFPPFNQVDQMQGPAGSIDQTVFGDGTWLGNHHFAQSDSSNTAVQPNICLSDPMNIAFAMQNAGQTEPQPFTGIVSASYYNTELNWNASQSPAPASISFQHPLILGSGVGAQHFLITGHLVACSPISQSLVPNQMQTEQPTTDTNLSQRSSSESCGENSPDAPRSKTTVESLPRCWEHGCNGRSFKSTRNLNRHQAEQQGLHAAVCSRCGARFSRKSNRDKHERICLNDRENPGKYETLG